MSIRILSESLINRIAAGEVIVRPSSVVKELVENSLDARSTRIFVELGNECRDVRVKDDGCGIATADAPMALVRHATSKLLEFDDLWDLQTRGFRGEALASIAAVARIVVLTHNVHEENGSRITAEGGDVPLIEPAGAPVGTDIRVRDLFYNTPARLKFMKSPASEMQQCVSIVLRQALIRPDIGFTVKGLKNEIVFDVPPLQPWGERIAALLGTGVSGNLIEVSRNSSGMVLQGFTLAPTYSRKDRRQQYFFINGRPITSRNLSAVLSEAYKGVMMVQRFPAAVLNIILPSGEVDVNVHPTKEEVRFRHESIVSGLVYRGVSEALHAKSQTTTSDLPTSLPTLGDGLFATSQNSTEVGRRPEQYREQYLRFDPSSMNVQSHALPGDFSKYTTPVTQPNSFSPVEAFVPAPLASSPGAVNPVPEEESGDWLDLLAGGMFPVPLGQIGLCYIVAALGKDMLLIDQHAAHERLLYQKFSSARENESVVAQSLLIPISMDVPVFAVAYVKNLIPILHGYGIDLEHFGGNTYVINSGPTDLPDMDVASVITDLLDDFEDRIGVSEIDDLRDRVVTRMACRAAIKAGQPLTIDQMQSLIRQLIESKMSMTCPHGRPTMMRVTLDRLDKLFKRKL